jgi:hypothetical protein
VCKSREENRRFNPPKPTEPQNVHISGVRETEPTSSQRLTTEQMNTFDQLSSGKYINFDEFNEKNCLTVFWSYLCKKDCEKKLTDCSAIGVGRNQIYTHEEPRFSLARQSSTNNLN